jgi:hypothetical protein
VFNLVTVITFMGITASTPRCSCSSMSLRRSCSHRSRCVPSSDTSTMPMPLYGRHRPGPSGPAVRTMLPVFSRCSCTRRIATATPPCRHPPTAECAPPGLKGVAQPSELGISLVRPGC